jgi:hypothetical protein
VRWVPLAAIRTERLAICCPLFIASIRCPGHVSVHLLLAVLRVPATVERKGRRAELNTFLTTLHCPQVDSLMPGIIVFFLGLWTVTSGISKIWSGEANGLWATQGRRKTGGVCTAGGRAGSMDAAGDEAGGIETMGDVPCVLWTADSRRGLRVACTQVG